MIYSSCEKGENERFGRIEFAICCDVTKRFKKTEAEVADSEMHYILNEMVDLGESPSLTYKTNTIKRV
jgi:hypothetical protein